MVHGHVCFCALTVWADPTAAIIEGLIPGTDCMAVGVPANMAVNRASRDVWGNPASRAAGMTWAVSSDFDFAISHVSSKSHGRMN